METREDHLFEEKAALLKHVSALATQYDIVRSLRKVTELYRLRAFLVTRLPGSTNTSLQSTSVVSSWPTELMARYDQAALMTGSAVLHRLRSSCIPFGVDLCEAAAATGQRGAELLAMFKAHNMQRFVVFPVSDPDGQRGTVSFYGDRALLDGQEMMELSLLSIHVFDRLYQIARSDHRPGEGLTDREIDCLNWTAAGKTSAEISEILGLSEHTVNHYLNRATRKLDTVNRTQAVAKALRTGIIS
ncbi:MAG: LuxR family transcriptional regulator [Rhizobium sp.]|nr:LuxR family transcriptional regulator [Rhizobium sp.]